MSKRILTSISAHFLQHHSFTPPPSSSCYQKILSSFKAFFNAVWWIELRKAICSACENIKESEVYWKDFRWKIIISQQCDINEKKIFFERMAKVYWRSGETTNNWNWINTEQMALLFTGLSCESFQTSKAMKTPYELHSSPPSSQQWKEKSCMTFFDWWFQWFIQVYSGLLGRRSCGCREILIQKSFFSVKNVCKPPQAISGLINSLDLLSDWTLLFFYQLIRERILSLMMNDADARTLPERIRSLMIM